MNTNARKPGLYPRGSQASTQDSGSQRDRTVPVFPTGKSHIACLSSPRCETTARTKITMELIPVTDLKQWAYCQRIVYYHRVMPAIVKPTFKMREAIAAQDLIENLEMRRGLRAYGLESAQRRFGVWLKDEALGLSAKTDLLLETTGRIAVVDFKLTAGEVGDNHKMQLAGYSMLAEAAYQLPAPVAFIFRIPDNRVFPIEISPDLRAAVTKAIADIQTMADQQLCPPPTPVRGRCTECEFANYCADIW